MPFDSDVALLGTGVAPLVAAARLLAEGKSVLLLNPDWDFFGEDSELPLDPLAPHGPASLAPERLARSGPDYAIEQLRPDFPGAVELWDAAGAQGKAAGFRDSVAPHVRARARLWVELASGGADASWAQFEDRYVEASDAGLNPQLLDGILALKRFPGYGSAKPGGVLGEAAAEARGFLLPRMSDVDVYRYRNGLLEFVRERLGPDRLVTGASEIELTPEGLRFRSAALQGGPASARIRDGVVGFWTPRLTPWVLAQAKRFEAPIGKPRGMRLWEQWTLVSRDPLDPGIVGMFENMAVWAEVEGPADGAGRDGLTRLSVLRPGPLVGLDSVVSPADPRWGSAWASADSFRAISRLCHGLLRWERFSVRAMRPRAIFEWEGDRREWALPHAGVSARIAAGGDGPLVDVVRAARAVAEGMT